MGRSARTRRSRWRRSATARASRPHAGRRASTSAGCSRALDGVDDRQARYVCELVAIAPDGHELTGRGILEGRIAASARGAEGFGFDPIFIPDGAEQTVAELGDQWKTSNSHRARAARALEARLS